MKQSIADQWRTTLEAGGLKQVEGKLCRYERDVDKSIGDDNEAVTTIIEQYSYCCLGVLAEKVIGKSFKARSGDEGLFKALAASVTLNLITEDQRESGVLSEDTLEAIEMNSEAQGIFTVLNDEAKLTFEQIGRCVGAINTMDIELWHARQRNIDANERYTTLRNDYQELAGKADANAKRLADANIRIIALEGQLADNAASQKAVDDGAGRTDSEDLF